MELEHGLKQIDIAPMIDVVFLLLIFFMLTSGFILQPGISVSLPKAFTSEVIKPDNIEIMVTSENVTYFNAKIVSFEELKALLSQAAKRNSSILIKADKRVSLGRIVEVWDLARSFKITQINIATN